ncbi:MAG: hypothetical protein HY711_07425, partial [Candidatus Melainabacteria bacterium]|nr:hypothetical protein [Candidatus Melainabacteria bacterium]
MATSDRRNFMSLDEAYRYCCLLETKAEKPDLFKMLSSLKTVDAALRSASGQPTSWVPPISPEAWSQVRDTLFNLLITSFSGFFLIYAQDDTHPLEAGAKWP